MRTRPALTLALLLVAAVATAQETPAPSEPFREEVEVSEVLLDVLVTDRDGNVIVGLRPEDFVVEEDGKPVPLLDVAFYSNRPLLDASGRRTQAAGSERYFILFFHDQRTVNSEVPGILARQLDAGRRAREWVDTLQLDDWVAVVSYEASLKVHQDFTRDRAEIADAVGKAVRGAEPGGNWESRLPPEGEPSLLRNLPRGRELLEATHTVQEALSEVARASAPLVGRKNLAMFSTGFGRVNSMNQYTVEERHHEPMVRALNDANVAIYAIDLAPPSVEFPVGDALSLVASETGGRYFNKIVHFNIPLEQTAEETSGYYLLSYRATHPRGRTGFQRVKVTVENPEFRVKTRSGYAYGD
jgi:VWFA-related protein